MWQALGTVAVSALGGSLLIHYLKNFFLQEKEPWQWDLDGLLERSLITGLVMFAPQLTILIPFLVLAKVIYRLIPFSFLGRLAEPDQPGIVFQKIRWKSELIFDLILSPAWAILIGIIF